MRILRGGDAQGLDGLLDRLEAAIGRLSDPTAPLDRLVADYEEAGRLVEAAQSQLDALTPRLAVLRAKGPLEGDRKAVLPAKRNP